MNNLKMDEMDGTNPISVLLDLGILALLLCVCRRCIAQKDTGESCQLQDVKSFSPCGNRTLYLQITGKHTFNFYRFKDKCIGPSMTPKRDGHISISGVGTQICYPPDTQFSNDYYCYKRSWDSARQYCRSLGGDLLSMEDKDIEAHIFADQRYVSKNDWWIGAQNCSDNLAFCWHDNGPRISQTNPHMLRHRYKRKRECLIVAEPYYIASACESTYSWICELPTTDYTQDLSLELDPSSPPYTVDDVITITCKSRSYNENVRLIIRTRGGRLYTAYAIGRQDFVATMGEIGVISGMSKDPVTRFVGPRCYAWYHVELRVRLSTKIDQATLECNTDDQNSTKITLNLQTPSRRDGGFTAWTTWSGCSVSCGSGTQVRTRSCTNPTPAYGGRDCTGDRSSRKNCNSGRSCPVDGGYSNWSSWGSCSVTCASGTRTRTRTCTNPSPAHGGRDCSGQGRSRDSKSCNSGRHCPMDGGYSSWTTWSQCSVTCGAGTRTRTRTCNDPPPGYGGKDCTRLGTPRDAQTCRTGVACPAATCPAGKYGPYCKKSCSTNCAGAGNRCDRNTGICDSGCDPGYTGSKCDSECPKGKYGANCGKTCSSHCAGSNNPCDHKDGSCDKGCNQGYSGSKCDSECPAGKYGANCRETCSSHCAGTGNPCDHLDGSCDAGCDPGYGGSKCDSECRAGRYGKNCGQTCSVHCLGGNKLCDHKDGSCDKGCEDGWTGSKCDKVDDSQPLIATLVLGNLTSQGKGQIEVVGCDNIGGSCTGNLGPNGRLEFVVGQRTGDAVWKSGDGRKNITAFARVSDFTDYSDDKLGKSLRLALKLYVTHKMVAAKYACVAKEYSRVIRDEIKGRFRIIVGSLPPKLTSNAEELKRVDILLLTCVTQVGESDSMTWELLDHKGRTLYWFVSEQGVSEGLKGSSVFIAELVSYSTKDPCGKTLTTKFKVNLSKLRYGATLSCISYNVRKGFKSTYPEDKLRVSYKLLGGGYIEEETDDLLMWILIATGILASLLTSLLCCFCCWPVKKKDEDKVIDEAATPVTRSKSKSRRTRTTSRSWSSDTGTSVDAESVVSSVESSVDSRA